ncbi:MAG: 2-amino-4-hydroxy-6-hydroxymethyldihydropteridine diphosphokinase [Methylococcales bacterium]|nr:2-amino-4-hydroxy-6-hydroxymethyldihydropteridine diphosphokinase [Methylococcales bacterium]MDD5754026.1 2-amino-4-hydroxy-6-hydroxymethyldihydropteridine diphosphokinase [Methylococcales bacterium]
MAQCYVSVGSNIDKAKNIEAGLNSLRETFGTLTVSPIYETVAVGFEGDNFYNLVVGFTSDLSARAVFQILRDLEFKHGRLPNSQKFSPRRLDLDLLLFGEEVIDDGILKLPRADIEKYAFVLQPLADIAPNSIHPVLQKTYQKMLESLLSQLPEPTLGKL